MDVDLSIQNMTPSLREQNKLATTNYVANVLDSLGVVRHGDSVPQQTYGPIIRPFRISAYILIESNRWKYAGDLVYPVRSQAGNLAYDTTSPFFETTELWNDCEEQNLNPDYDGGFAYGNGVVVNELPAGFEIKPIPTGMVVWAREVLIPDGSNIVSEWRFAMPNGISGSCPP